MPDAGASRASAPNTNGNVSAARASRVWMSVNTASARVAKRAFQPAERIVIRPREGSAGCAAAAFL